MLFLYCCWYPPLLQNESKSCKFSTFSLFLQCVYYKYLNPHHLTAIDTKATQVSIGYFSLSTIIPLDSALGWFPIGIYLLAENIYSETKLPNHALLDLCWQASFIIEHIYSQNIWKKWVYNSISSGLGLYHFSSSVSPWK